MACSRFRNRIEVYSKVKVEDELGQTDFEYKYLKSVWAQISISNRNNGEKEIAEEKATIVETNFKFVLRKEALPNISRDMYFVYKGQKYDIEYFIPNFKNRGLIECICKLVIER